MEIPLQIAEAMVAHARFTYPKECCGLLAVDADGAVRMAYCLTNTRHSTRRFSVDPTEHYRALGHAESLGWQLGGVFHSHPRSAAYPSPVDIAAGLDPEWLNVIVSLAEPDQPVVRGFWIRRGAVTEVPVMSPVPVDGAA